MSKALSSIKLYSMPTAKPIIDVPEPTKAHFWTAGRMLSWFPKVNGNGFCFLKEDCPDDVVQTLFGSLTDIEHVKLGNFKTSEEVTGTNNAAVGSITKVVNHDDGIDIQCKMDREVVELLGYGPTDFAPSTGLFSSYSQECHFQGVDGKFIVVDKNDPMKILKSLSYVEGCALGYVNKNGFPSVSYLNTEGTWTYTLNEGNPVYYAVKPTSFSGVGHVCNPADTTAITYKLAASLGGLGVNLDNEIPGAMDFSDLNPTPKFYEKHGIKGSDGNYHLPLPPKGHPQAKRYARAVLTRAHQVTKLTPEQVARQVKKARDILGESNKSLSDYAGMDCPAGAYYDMTGYGDMMPNTTDTNVWTDMLATMPDVMTADIDDMDEDDNPKFPDDHYAACYSDEDWGNKVDGDPVIVKHRAFRIKNDKGELDRPKLIAALHALAGSRGAIHKATNLPSMVRQHALAKVHQGLIKTNPTFKETSSMTPQEESELLEKAKQELIKSGEYVALSAHQAIVAEKETLTTKVTALEEKNTLLTASVTEKDAALAEIASKELSSVRYAALEAVLPFTDEEKADAGHADYIKSLASLSEDGFATAKIARENAALKKQLSSINKSLSSHNPGLPRVNLTRDPEPEVIEKPNILGLF